MSDNLDTLSDADLNELFAVEVAEIWRRETPRDGGIRAYSAVRTGAWREIRTTGSPPDDLPDYAIDANAVLPWLEKHAPVDILISSSGLTTVLISTDQSEWVSVDKCFARAACIALIRAKRASP